MPQHLKQVQMVLQGGAVKRYHSLFTVQQQTVAAHSFRVAMLALILMDSQPRAALLHAALVHDLAEAHTGDIPAQVKVALGLTERFAELENNLLDNCGLAPLTLTVTEQRALKLADCLDGVLFCNEEIALGNSKMLEIRERYLSYIASQGPYPSGWQNLIDNVRHQNP